MLEADRVRLRHMLDASRKLDDFTRARTRQDLDTDEMLSLAVVRLLEILGEAASRVSDAFQAAHPEIPWRQIAGTRNRLIHGYFDVDLNIVWQIVQGDLPSLAKQLEAVVGAE